MAGRFVMSVGVKKTLLAFAIGLLVFGAAIPVLFWLAARAADRALSLQPLTSSSLSLMLAAACGVVGLFWVTWSFSYLVFVGKGLPVEAFGKALHPTSELVTMGPYAYTRNPMVLGYLTILLGVAFLARSISGVVLVPVMTLIGYLYIRTFEEKALVGRFGPDYEVYRGKVPALFPRLSAYIHGAE